VAKSPQNDPQRRGQLETLEKPKQESKSDSKIARPPLYEVLLHNDDYTTQEFVVYVLERFFHHDATTARQIMLHVHTRGIGVAGVFPYDLAETKVRLVTELARSHEMPLKCTLRKQSS
jgi:ATP-dependent Clp protease adaptor protein ClpS